MSKIRLVIADVDGTLATPDKELTERARRAVIALWGAGVALRHHQRATAARHEHAGPSARADDADRGVRRGDAGSPGPGADRGADLPTAIVGQIVEAIGRHKLDVWLYCGADWFIRALTAPHVDREQRTVHFGPAVVSSFDEAVEKYILADVGRPRES